MKEERRPAESSPGPGSSEQAKQRQPLGKRRSGKPRRVTSAGGGAVTAGPVRVTDGRRAASVRRQIAAGSLVAVLSSTLM